MSILLTNDDGISSLGLRALESAAAEFGEVLTVAPEKEQSATSHRFTLHKPLRAYDAGERRWSISGSPADCSYIGINHFSNSQPKMVLSGINRGPNLGNDVFYSGTAAGAREGCFHGIPSVAFSLNIRGQDTQHHWETAEHAARWVASRVLERGLPARCYLNVNIPNVPLADLKGYKAVPLGPRVYKKAVTSRVDPRGREYLWIGGGLADSAPKDGSDSWAVDNNWVSITPISLDISDTEFLNELHKW